MNLFSMSMSYTPQLNGAAERENRTIVESVRCMIYARSLPLKLWAEAVNTSVYVLNHTVPTSIKDKSPYELWFSKEVINIDHLHVFGRECYLNKKGGNGTKRVCGFEDAEESLVQQSSRNLRDRSILKMPTKFDSFILLAEYIEPQTYKEAMASEDSDKWLAAMKEELESLSINNTWVPVNLLSDRKP
ncbi:retrovirus-related Pol polyprotein from transposon TNT 1-94 [Trichonephila clavata]|uniref:Retrovirus-related Pol polyprotein from transposon TNT 1-94 n=1 Tax=Trichonephila clavata TaxID=2740835 RepID=A0A8X6F9R8_TRICU|nr:retrovirus-related Pol polyprotein from transposon TNT 1-94 [Trichonephila clavata]